MNDAALQALTEIVWHDGGRLQGEQVYWLLDGARDPDIAGLVGASGLPYSCLFTGPLHPRLEAAAPYLVQLPASAPAARLLLRRGWGQAWGILIVAGADVTLAQLRLHLKKFLRVKTEDGKTLAFRYYDPRVLKLFLPTCTGEELRGFLGPMTRLIAESDGGAQAQAYALRGDMLQTQQYPLASVV